MALGSTRLLTEIIDMNLYWGGQMQSVRKANNLTTFI